MPASRQQTEHVLVVPTLLFQEIGYFQGFHDRHEPYLKTLLDPAYTSYRLRDTVEEDPSFKQLIPYCIFRHEGRIFHYKRIYRHKKWKFFYHGLKRWTNNRF